MRDWSDQARQETEAFTEALNAALVESERPEKFASMREAVVWVARKHAVTPGEVIGRDSRRSLNAPREEFIFICRNDMEKPKSYPQIARFMGNRNHTTILHYDKKQSKRNSMGHLASITRMRDAAKHFAERHGLDVEELLGRSMAHFLTPARREFVTFCRKKLERSYGQIGAFMGGRDAESVRHYIKGVR